MTITRDLSLARKARSHGMRNSLRIIWEARRAGVPISLAFAIIEQESGNGMNIWGGDPAPNGQTNGMNNDPVTKANYRSYHLNRGRTGQGGMQGVGPMQLTWWEFQDEADRLGGCWVPKFNIRVGLTHLSKLIERYGNFDGIRRYNGGGSAAQHYAESVLRRQKKWHGWLT